MKLFKPNGNLMSQLSTLTKKNAKSWLNEYTEYHETKDTGLNYIIGYFPEKHRNMLRKEFKFI